MLQLTPQSRILLALAGLIEPIKREARQGAVKIADAQRLALATPKQRVLPAALRDAVWFT